MTNDADHAETDPPGDPSRTAGARRIVYKEGDLALHVFFPRDWNAGDRRAAVVYFHGGGWSGGDAGQFADFARTAAGLGLVAATAEYGLARPPERLAGACMADARDAFAFVLDRAADLGVDPQRIAAGGGSAGGQLALSLAFADAPPALRPAALVLMNPVLSFETDVFDARFGGRDAARAVAPLTSMGEDLPPMILFLGTHDDLTSVGRAETFRDLVNARGGPLDLRLFEGEGHGFFNRFKGERCFAAVDAAAGRFLVETLQA